MRKGIISNKAIIFGIIMLFVGASVLQQTNTTVKADLTDGLIDYWSFNEGSGTVAHDTSGFGNDGNINGATWTIGVSGSALEITDTDYVGGIPASFDDSITTAFTVTAWIKWYGPHSYTGNSFIFDGRGSPSIGEGFIFYIDQLNDNKLKLWLNESSGIEVAQSTSTIPIGSWTHVAAVFDDSSNSCRLYINGYLDNTATITKSYHQNSGTAMIGNNHYLDGNWASINGIVDEIRIYNRVLTSDEIQNLFNPPTLVGYWSFDEGSGTIANDNSDNGNDGIINGATWTTVTPNNEGYALNFSGSNDYVIQNPFNNFPMMQMTVTFWMKTSDTLQDGCPVSYASSATANDFVISNYRDFAMVIGDQTIGPTGVSANDGIWHHIALTWQNSNGQMKLYKDGVVKYTGTVFTGGSITPSGSLVIGCDQDSVGGGFESNQFFKGIIDEVRIYNRVLSNDEITELASIANQLPTADAGGPYYANINNAITFDGSGSSDTDGTIAGYRWDFTNDGTYDTSWLTSATTAHSYSSVGTYTVKLEVKDNDGALDTDTATATITTEGGAVPTADVNGPYSGYVNNPVTFSSSGSVGGTEGTITAWYWTFGDGTVSSQQNPTHSYTSSGTFTVTLKVTNNYGQTDTDTTTATISDISPDQSPPVADAGGPYLGVVGTPITFDGSGSSDLDGTIVSYLWNFGDSTTGTGISPTHTFTIPGNYTVILTVTDNESLTHSNSTTVSINVSGPPTIIIAIASSNIEPIEEENEKTFSITVQCEHQSVSNIHLVILEKSNLTIIKLPSNISLNPGESRELFITIKAPKLNSSNNSKQKVSDETIILQAVGDGNVTSNTEQVNFKVIGKDATPGFETVATITAVGTAGALVTFFRRRNRNR